MRTSAPLAILFLALGACSQTKAPPAPAASSTSAAVVGAPKAVSKIVFIDKENACDCTRKRQAGTWDALQKALATAGTLPVERIHFDTESPKAQPFMAQKALMVPPGVYFTDGSGTVIDTLQGEVTTDQIVAVLKRK